MSELSKKSKDSERLNDKTAVEEVEPSAKRKKGGRPSKIDKPLLMLAKEHPEMNLHQLGKELVDMGVCKDPTSVYRRPIKNTFVAGELDEIHRRNLETMSSQIVPEALKIHKKALRSKDLTLKEKQPWVALAEKAEFSSYDGNKNPPVSGQINIKTLQLAQVLISQNLESGPSSSPLEIEDILDVEAEEI